MVPVKRRKIQFAFLDHVRHGWMGSVTGENDSGAPQRAEPELDRIRGAYARRKRESMGDRYALHRPGPLCIRSQQLQQVARALRAEGVLPFSDRRITL